MNIEKIIKIFDEYVHGYDINESQIELKYAHSYRVMNICKEIAEDLNLNDEDVKLAMVIGILHDYARFEQWAKFKTFSDANSIDHGDLAVKLLFTDNEIEKFDIPQKDYQVIYEAIKYHNKCDYPENTSERNKMFCKLIKDADKLDIFYLVSIGKIKVINDDSNISEIVNKGFYEEKLLRKEDVKTNSDRVLFRLALVYDFNFKYSYKYIKENNIAEKMFSLVNENEKFKPYFSYINNYIDERSKEYVRKKV